MYTPPPSPNYDKDINRLISYYKAAYKSVLAGIVKLSTTKADENIYLKQASLLRQIEVILAQLDKNNQAWVSTTVSQAFLDGQAAAILTAGGAATLAEAVGQVKNSMISKPVVDSLINDTYSDLLKATNNTSNQIKNLVQQVTGDVLRRRTAENYGRQTISKEIRDSLTKKTLEQKLSKDGFLGIIDKAGRRWSYNRYAEMVTRTKLNQAHVEGVRVEGVQRGIDLAVISTHNAADECNQFEGMLISMNGLTKGLLSYEEIRNSNKCFHPNCQHKVHAVKLELLPKAVLDKHKAKAKELKIDGLKGKIKPLESIQTPSKEEVKNLSEQLTLAL